MQIKHKFVVFLSPNSSLYIQELKQSIQALLTTKIAVYLMTFLIVTVAWAAHIRWEPSLHKFNQVLTS